METQIGKKPWAEDAEELIHYHLMMITLEMLQIFYYNGEGTSYSVLELQWIFREKEDDKKKETKGLHIRWCGVCLLNLNISDLEGWLRHKIII